MAIEFSSLPLVDRDLKRKVYSPSAISISEIGFVRWLGLPFLNMGKGWREEKFLGSGNSDRGPGSRKGDNPGEKVLL